MFRGLNWANKKFNFTRPALLGSAASLILWNKDKLFGMDNNQDFGQCCGIVGYIGKDKIGFQVISEGISILENRGYDSIGKFFCEE
jgi:hypothetical protein